MVNIYTLLAWHALYTCTSRRPNNVQRLKYGGIVYHVSLLEEDVKVSTLDRRGGGAVDGGPTSPGGGMSVPG